MDHGSTLVIHVVIVVVVIVVVVGGGVAVVVVVHNLFSNSYPGLRFLVSVDSVWRAPVIQTPPFTLTWNFRRWKRF